MIKQIRIKLSVIDSILTYAFSSHPNESILLLRGKVSKEIINVENVMIPPLSIHGESYSSFPMHMLPLDSSIIGTAHSHPSGLVKPSLEDLLHYYGKIMAIAGYPYRTERDIKIFDREGRELPFTVEG
ncbi:MAG: Mov34/MPN/PAD-1 family protein [Nitrososphaeria archaeon]|jgi:proteasome lid subunit RPN8/RPN11